MEHENTTDYERLKDEVAGMRGEISRVLDYIKAKEEKEWKAREEKESRPKPPARHGSFI